MSTNILSHSAPSYADLERRNTELLAENQALRAQVEEARLLIEEHALADRERYLNAERFQQIFDCAPIGLTTVSLEGRFISVNRALAEMLGYTPEELLALRFQDITHADDLETDIELVGKTIRGEIPRYKLKKRYIHRDGSIIHVLLHVALVRDEDGAPVHFISQILDMTEQKRAFEALQTSEERLRQLSTPLVPIRDDVVAMPLIGAIDANRADRVLEVLLTGISGGRVRVAILDVTGVVDLDEQVAAALVRTAHAVRLLGAQMILSGIRSEVARTLVDIGADFSGFVTCANLQAAITHAFRLSRGRAA
ncbi:STAS domain-containing protein [Polyangium jinanense]|uniref:PAS domain S-box protein n=1 Tax=Polyangium jinanense TaxID=2829994 RepID=A0A9X3WV61_9BACT|nr:PAS domain S-box protein [Polyangium jinanense]MDC3953949.1 PAS domain S-box protein [Polyangium jinanense]MDC3957838.1 PAS domain S-box protein [Polyangium jinanense]MDC3978924.1 PAS domain S-box protein [Polyangium jinanense]MDC3982095.1 PAS domain S-box protein [Polyangium jinanense]